MTVHQPNATDTDAGLADAIRLLGRTNVLVVGDVMLDRYVYGTVERVSPEAPVPILAIEREITMPGGAGNVVRNLTALGAAVAFISVVGDDQAGSDLTGLIGGQPNVEPWLLVQGGRVTTLKTRYLSAGQHLLRADREETRRSSHGWPSGCCGSRAMRWRRPRSPCCRTTGRGCSPANCRRSSSPRRARRDGR